MRTKYAFRDRPTNPSYIPQFYIKQEDWEPPPASTEIERALGRVRNYLYDEVAKIPKLAARHNPNTQDLRRFLLEKKYLVKATDKNLGLCVVTLDWYKEQCSIHLRNTVAYSDKNEIDMFGIRHALLDILDSQYLPASIKKWILSTTEDMPKFYVLPKVHKSPWASRPIIPSHSWITSRVAEVVDYCLQPYLTRFPTILNSTQEFISKLRQLSLPENCWLVTGDVTAMYTNIPSPEAIDVVGSILDRESQRVRKSDLLEMIRFVLENNWFTFGGNSYHQVSGLAMGVACAPVIANLYCGVYEKSRFKYRSRFVFYGRYIDDIFAIVRGTREEVDSLLRSWRMYNLKITWNVSNDRLSFLDVEVLLKGIQLVTRVSTKVLNKHMYIPFSSGHPVSVKRAFVKAERMRYHRICSSSVDAIALERELFLNLLRRGYPKKVLEVWFRDALTSRQRPEPKLVLSSEYNPVWEYIRMGPVKEILKEVSTEDFDGLDSIVTSLKRGQNLMDLFCRINMTQVSELVD